VEGVRGERGGGEEGVRECGVNVLAGHARVVLKGVLIGGYLIRRLGKKGIGSGREGEI